VVIHDSWWGELINSSITADSVLAPIMRTREEWESRSSLLGGAFAHHHIN
jgi:hypothetical protein